MARRTPETLADYVVVGVAPALIMLLIGSLVFFLIGVFYQGEFPYRLTWVMGLFVLATVCVARISMEEGASYAALFGIPLGVVVGIAVVYFVKIEGPLAPFSALINWGLLALIWWCAHQLTWDCTLIDDRRDTTGQGLLRSMGWENPAMDGDAASSSGGNARGAMSGSVSPFETNNGSEQPAWWQRLFQHRDQPAAHGRWVVYFSVAALPLFGLGQFFIPVADAASRRYAFWMLVIYVGSALGLLLTTSFLGLRRYIRQRQLEMPVEMTAVWLSVGVAMIVGLLAAAALLPRPAPEYSIADAVQARLGRFTSPDRSPSQYGVGSEGEKSQDPAQANSAANSGDDAGKGAKSEGQGTGRPAQDDESHSPRPANKSGAGQGESSAQSNKSDQSEGGGPGGSKANGSPDRSENQAGKTDAGRGNPAEDSAGQQSDSTDRSGRQSEPDSSGGNQQNSSNPSPPEANTTAQGQESSKADTKADSASAISPEQTASPNSSSSAQSPPILNQLATNLGNLLRWAFYAVVAVIAVILAWKYRHELAAAWHQLLIELRELWQRWFGGKPTAVAEQATATALPKAKTFREFADPFASGHAQRMPMPQLVQYSFDALEAWGREFAVRRENGQTPHEYGEAVGLRQPSIDMAARQLAEIYSRMAYARQTPPAQTATVLRALWQGMNELARGPLTGGTVDRPVGSV